MKFEDLLTITGEWTEKTGLNLVLCTDAAPPMYCTAGEIDNNLGKAEVIAFSKELVVVKVDDIKAVLDLI